MIWAEKPKPFQPVSNVSTQQVHNYMLTPLTCWNLAVSCSWHKVSKCLEQSLEHQCFFWHTNTAEISRLVKKVKSTCRPLWQLFFFSLKKLVHHADWSMKKNFSAFFLCWDDICRCIISYGEFSTKIEFASILPIGQFLQ